MGPAHTEAAPGAAAAGGRRGEHPRSIRRVLRRGDWEIETAAGRRARARSLARLPPEVVISDFRMPGMNGVEFLTRVKEQRAARPAHHAHRAGGPAGDRRGHQPLRDLPLHLQAVERQPAGAHREERVRAVRAAWPRTSGCMQLTQEQNERARDAQRGAGGAGAAAHPCCSADGQARVGADVRLHRPARWRWCSARTTRCAGRTSPTRASRGRRSRRLRSSMPPATVPLRPGHALPGLPAARRRSRAARAREARCSTTGRTYVVAAYPMAGGRARGVHVPRRHRGAGDDRAG